MSEQELRQHRCCFTGHRPERLGMPKSEVVFGLKEEIRTAIADGFQTFISGMARGVDLWAAESVLALRDEGTAVRLICASPYQGFESRWNRVWQERYRPEKSSSSNAAESEENFLNSTLCCPSTSPFKYVSGRDCVWFS